MIRFVDTSLCAAQHAVWGGHMTSAMLLPILRRMDGMGFAAIDILDADVLAGCAALGEDPWDRLRQAAVRCRTTPLNVWVDGRRLFGTAPCGDGEVAAMVRRLGQSGALALTCYDAAGEVRHLATALRAAADAGMHRIGALVFSVSPAHTAARFAESSRDLVSLGVDRVCLFDPAGLLTPDRAAALIPALRTAIGTTPLELRTSTRSGLAEKVCFESARVGVGVLATAAAPLAGGGSYPAADYVAESLGRLKLPVVGCADELAALSDYFGAIAEREGLAAAGHALPDPDADRHQLPGPLLAELETSARERGIPGRRADLFAEIARLREALGGVAPVMALGRSIVRQAVDNVASGACAMPPVDATASDAATSRPASRQGAAVAPPVDADTPLAQLMAELERRPWVSRLDVRKGDLVLALGSMSARATGSD